MRGGGHEGNQRVPHGLLDGVLGGPVEGHGVDDGLDDHALVHQSADGLGHVLIVPPQAVHPTDHQHIPSAHLIQQPGASLAVLEAGGDAGHPIVLYDRIELEAGGISLVELVADGLIRGADAGVQERVHTMSVEVMSA